MVQFCDESIDTGKENWRALFRDEVLNAKINENTEPHEKMTDNEKGDCVDHESVQQRFYHSLKLSE